MPSLDSYLAQFRTATPGDVPLVDLDAVPPAERRECYLKIPPDAPTLHKHDARTIDELCDWLETRYSIELPWCISSDYQDGDPDLAPAGSGFFLQKLTARDAQSIAQDRQRARAIYAEWKAKDLAERPNHELYDAKMAAMKPL